MSTIRNRLASEGGRPSTLLPTNKIRILLIGSGGREHALTWRLEQSDLVDQVFVAPGNGGTALGAKSVNVNVPISEFDDLADFATGANVNLVIVGPEQPLVDGIERVFRQIGIPVFGPSQRAAAMEGSKAFSKDFMKRHNIPTARYETFTDFDAACQHVLSQPKQRVVLKASGLAAGKGVLLPGTADEAVEGLKGLMIKREFGSAADEVVIEDFLQGEELSVLAFCDGYTILPLPAAQDHKAIGEGDTGPNTGGMGAYSPAPLATPALDEVIMRTILRPTIDGMRRDGYPFVGMLFTGIMVGPDSVPRVLEYNVRFGDPETQALLALLAPETDLAAVILAAAERRLDSIKLSVRPGAAVSVVLASAGYPGEYDTGKVITVGQLPAGVHVFHAGTDGRDGKMVSAGGRVMNVVAYGETLEKAVELVYEGVKAVSFEGMIFRRDIAHRALKPRAPTAKPGLTYAAAGVDVDAGNSLVERIKPLVRATRRPGADADLGGFGGLFDLKATGYRDPILVSGTDGVGTKLKIAQAVGKHDTIGVDLVAMSVNDLIVQGAEPLYFLDYFACGKLDVDTAADCVKGVADACRDAGCALIGGETAEMPSLYAGADYDMAGFAVGAVERTELLPRPDVQVGDVLLGLASSGVHSNGFSLVRKVLETASLSYDAPCPWDSSAPSVGHALLEPTVVYVRQLLSVLRSSLSSIKALCHITGGGFTENVPRVLPKSCGAEIDVTGWTLPPVFDWIMRTGNVAPSEMCRTFNCGIGMVVVVAPEHAESLKTALAEFSGGAKVFTIGRLTDGQGVTMRGFESWRQ